MHERNIRLDLAPDYKINVDNKQSELKCLLTSKLRSKLNVYKNINMKKHSKSVT